MPVKNSTPFLEDCLNSIIKQSEKNWELIAVDDHSSDNSFLILQKYAIKDPRIKVFQNKGKGIIDALRLAYSKCKGSFITRMDSDDLMPPQKLIILKKILQKNGTGIVATGGVKYFADYPLGNGYLRYEKWLNELTYKESNFSAIYKECVIPSPCWMVYREDFEKIEAFNPNTYPEDYDLCFRFYKYGLQVKSSQEILHLWRDYSHRTSRTDKHYSDNRFFDIKINYFLELDRDKTQTLILWGAGKKGKFLAKKLLVKEVSFYWISNNLKKIDQDIYGKIIQSTHLIQEQSMSQLILTISSPSEQIHIKNILRNSKHQVFWFC